MATKKEIVLGLLDKVGAEYTSKITLDRASKKLVRYIEKNGAPEDLTTDEQHCLIGLGVKLGIEGEAQTAEEAEKPTLKKLPGKKKSSKKASSKKTSSRKAPAEKPKKERKPRTADWMTCAAKAVLNSKNLDDAGAKAAQIFRDAGGKVTPNTDANGKLYASFASKALVEAGVIEMDGKDIKKV